MISLNQNKFKSSPDNRFGRLPAQDKLSFDVTNGTSLCYLAPVPKWESLGITEEEYYQKYNVNPNIIRCVPEMDISGSWEYTRIQRKRRARSRCDYGRSRCHYCPY